MWYMHLPFRIKQYQKNNERNLARIRKKDKITVVFFASNVAMWKYQGLYEEMQKYPRFETYIVLSPLKNYTKEQNIQGFNDLKKLFDIKGIKYFDFDVKRSIGYPVKSLRPDILFYPQPYYTVMTYKPHRYYHFKNSLLAYYPYFFHRTRLAFEYDEDFHNRAWRLFYESIYQKNDARDIAKVKDTNVSIVGFPNADAFLTKSIRDVWKQQKTHLKRIIWAPHFTLYNDGWVNSSNFLWMADFMIEIAEKYKDKIQFAFKPHPKLLSELYNHPQWGKTKADNYYKLWEELENGQYENGQYIDLFMTSDAMIHDSGSFGVEYHYTKKPVMFISQDMNKFLKPLSDFGKKVYEMHYIGKNKENIIAFIENVVLAGEDKLYNKRIDFVNKYLLPPNGKTVAQNTMDEINRLLS